LCLLRQHLLRQQRLPPELPLLVVLPHPGLELALVPVVGALLQQRLALLAHHLHLQKQE
jgi:hypothetical protein